MVTGRFLMFLFPFLKEMILGSMSIPEAIKGHKKKLLLIAAILLSFFLNIYTIPKLISISAAYIDVKKKHDQLTGIAAPEKKPSEPVKVPNTSVPPITPPSASIPPDSDYDRYSIFQSNFAKMIEDEKSKRK